MGKGNTHTLDNIPFALVGGGLNSRMGRSPKRPRGPHNRLLLSLAHGFGHRIPRFGNPTFAAMGRYGGLHDRHGHVEYAGLCPNAMSRASKEGACTLGTRPVYYVALGARPNGFVVDQDVKSYLQSNLP
jgi:hypothetical protein